MAAAVPLIVQAAATYLGASKLVAAVAVMASSLISGKYEKRRAEKKARAARIAGLEDRKLTIATAEYPKVLLYGQCKVGGQIVDRYVSGANDEFFTLCIKIADSEITAIDDVFIGDKSVGALDGNGWVTGGPFFAQTSQVSAGLGAVVPSSPFKVNLPKTPAAGSVAVERALSTVSEAGTETLVGAGALTPGVDFSVSGSEVTFASALAGAQVVITYVVQEGVSCLQVRKYLGSVGQVADPDRIAESPGWTSADVGTGVAHVFLKFRYHPAVLSQGISEPSFVVRGRKVLDPRTGLTNYSDNAALCLRDYLLNPLGGGLALADLDPVDFLAAANACDELVPTKSLVNNVEQTVSIPRYTVSAVCTTGEDSAPVDFVAMFLAAMAGELAWTGSRYRLQAGVFYSPVGVNLGEDDLAQGAITISAKPDLANTFNTVRGTFVDPQANFIAHDFPPYRSAAYVSEDGGRELPKTFQFNFVNQGGRCQRIAKLIMFRARQALTVRASFKAPALRLEVLDNFTLNLPTYGINGVFKVREISYNPEDQIVQLLAQEDAAAVYAWSFTEQAGIDPNPNTSFPSVRDVAALSGLQAVSGADIYQTLADGTKVAQARVSWALHPSPLVRNGGRVELRWRRLYETSWQTARVFGSDTTFTIQPVVAGERLAIAARATNTLGGESDWSNLYPYTVDSAAPANNNPTRIGVGVNWLANSDFRQGLVDWSVSASALGASSGVNLNSDYTLVGEGTAWLRDGSAVAGSTFILSSSAQPRAVEPGQRLEGSAYVNLHRCSADLIVQWLNSSGVNFASSTLASRGANESTTRRLEDFDRMFGFAVAPPGAALAQLAVVKQQTSSGSDSYAFISRAYLGVAHASQTQPSPWTPGSPRGALAVANRAADRQFSEINATEVFAGFTAANVLLLHQLDVTLPEPAEVDLLASLDCNFVGVGGAGVPTGVTYGVAAIVQVNRVSPVNNALLQVLGDAEGWATKTIPVGGLGASGPSLTIQRNFALSLPAGAHRFQIVTTPRGAYTTTGTTVYPVEQITTVKKLLSARMTYR